MTLIESDFKARFLMRRFGIDASLCFAILGLVLVSTINVSHVYAETVVDRSPRNIGGPGSDTQYRDEFGIPEWQQLADDFQISQSTTIHQVTWWGFYDADNAPAVESVRIRVYNARTSDGLPGSVLSESTIGNHARFATGRRVAVGVGPKEYIFTANLDSPVSLVAMTIYWLEIVQVGDESTAFRWEFGPAFTNGFSFRNQDQDGWLGTLPGGNTDLAFQLSTVPEPATCLLLTCGAATMLSRRRHLRARPSKLDRAP